MWFFIGAIILIALIAVWFSRTNLYRARSTGRNVKARCQFERPYPQQPAAAPRGFPSAGTVLKEATPAR